MPKYTSSAAIGRDIVQCRKSIGLYDDYGARESRTIMLPFPLVFWRVANRLPHMSSLLLVLLLLLWS